MRGKGTLSLRAIHCQVLFSEAGKKPVEGLGVSSSSHVLPVQSQQLVQVHGASIPMWKAGKPLRIKPGAGTWCGVGKCEMNPDGKELRPQLIAGSHQWNRPVRTSRMQLSNAQKKMCSSDTDTG